MKENLTNSDLSAYQNISESPLNNEQLVQFIFELVTSDKLENIVKLEFFLDHLQKSEIEVKISETSEFLISHCLTSLITQGHSKPAEKLSQLVAIASASDLESYHIISGILNSRSSETIDDTVKIIKNFTNKGLNTIAKSEEGKMIIEYAIEQYLHSTSTGSWKGSKIKEGDAEIVKCLINSIFTPLKKSDKNNFCEKIISKTFTFEEFQEALQNFENPRKNNFYKSTQVSEKSTATQNTATISLNKVAVAAEDNEKNDEELDDFLNKDVKIKPLNKPESSNPMNSPELLHSGTNLVNSILPTQITKYFL